MIRHTKCREFGKKHVQHATCAEHCWMHAHFFLKIESFFCWSMVSLKVFEIIFVVCIYTQGYERTKQQGQRIIIAINMAYMCKDQIKFQATPRLTAVSVEWMTGFCVCMHKWCNIRCNSISVCSCLMSSRRHKKVSSLRRRYSAHICCKDILSKCGF